MEIILVGVECGKCLNRRHVVELACSNCGERYSYGVGNPLNDADFEYCSSCGGKVNKEKSETLLKSLVKSLK